MPEVLETSISWLALRYLKNNSVPSLAIYFFKWQHEVWKTSSCSQKVFKHRRAIRLKYHMHLHSSLYGSLVPDSDISSEDNGRPEEDGKSPPLDPANGCRSPGGHSTHIQRRPNSSIAALMCFTHWDQALLAAQGGMFLPKKRKEIADTNYHFAIFNILALVWPIWTLTHFWIKFTMMSSKNRGKYFLGFEEETWPHKELHGESANPRCLSPHTLKADCHLFLTIQLPLHQETDRLTALASAPLTLLNLGLPKYPSERVSQEAASKGRKCLWNWYWWWIFHTPPQWSTTHRSELALSVPHLCLQKHAGEYRSFSFGCP